MRLPEVYDSDGDLMYDEGEAYFRRWVKVELFDPDFKR